MNTYYRAMIFLCEVLSDWAVTTQRPKVWGWATRNEYKYYNKLKGKK